MGQETCANCPLVRFCHEQIGGATTQLAVVLEQPLTAIAQDRGGRDRVLNRLSKIEDILSPPEIPRSVDLINIAIKALESPGVPLEEKRRGMLLVLDEQIELFKNVSRAAFKGCERGVIYSIDDENRRVATCGSKAIAWRERLVLNTKPNDERKLA